ncbi:MAG: translation initiation factor IF-3 [Opitutales bacterium]
MRRNERIRAPEVRVIGPEGKMIGIMSPKKATALAKEVGLDLIEVSPSAKPPVCRILDYGKYLYDESKKKKDNKSTSSKLKEVKFRISIDPHDLETKLRRAEGFLYHGNKVKVTLAFRGREMEHKDLGFERVRNAVQQLSHIAVMDAEPRLVGRQITLILSPVPANKRVLKFNAEDDDLDEEPEDDDQD